MKNHYYITLKTSDEEKPGGKRVLYTKNALYESYKFTCDLYDQDSAIIL